MLTLTLYRYLKERLLAEMDRDWKRNLLQVLLHGELSAVSTYHSGELINRLNNDVRILDDGILNTVPNAISMVVRLVAAMVVLIALEPWFTAAIVAAGIVVVLLYRLDAKEVKGYEQTCQ